MDKFKEYMVLNGDDLAFWLRDVMAPTDYTCLFFI